MFLERDIVEATLVITSELNDRKIAYVLIGGAACMLLGSKRSTNDIDIAVRAEPDDVQNLKYTLSNDSRFELRDIGGPDKLHYVAPGDDGSGVARPLMIEMMPFAKLLTLPLKLVSGVTTVSVDLDGHQICVLSPLALIFSKLGRLVAKREGVMPRSVAKFSSDNTDVRWLSQQVDGAAMHACFEQYSDVDKAKILDWLRDLAEPRQSTRPFDTSVYQMLLEHVIVGFQQPPPKVCALIPSLSGDRKYVRFTRTLPFPTCSWSSGTRRSAIGG